MACSTAQLFGSPSPGAQGSGKKVKYHLISIPKSISKIFKSNFVCLLTNERYITYQTGFLFHRLGHAPGVGLWGTGKGGKNYIFQNSTKFSLCVSHMRSMVNITMFLVPTPWGLREEPKDRILFYFNYKVNYKYF